MRALQAWWYDERLRSWLLQFALLALLCGSAWWFLDNSMVNLARRGMSVSFDFLWQAARFPISESLIAYAPTDTYARAFFVGLINTLFVSVIAICISTMTGLVLALARRSGHPLLTAAARTYIEVARNTPLVVHLLFWYLLLITSLPTARKAIEPLPHVFITVRGIFLPTLTFEHPGTNWSIWIAPGLFALLCLMLTFQFRRQARRSTAVTAALLAIVVIVVWFVLHGFKPRLDLPELRGLNFRGGTRLSPEFTALIVALVIYKTAFIAEIFRGGINAVHAGQWEAGRALGLRDRDTLRLIVLPQALRVIVPPMASQYLTAVKNTTIALAIGYPDFSGIVGTVINQSGRVLEGVGVMILVYLAVSLSVAGLMNWYNERIMLRGGR